MVHRLRSARRSIAAVSLLAVCVAAASPASQEAPLVRTTTDASLSWGPCPAFMPSGCAIAVLHGDPAAPNVDVLFKVPGGAILPPHSHTSAERMLLVSGELSVTYDGQPPMRLAPGSYAYGPAGLSHEGQCVSAEACVLFIAFEQPLDAIESPR